MLMADSSDQICSATIPASGPYVSPNDELTDSISPSPSVTTDHSTIETAAPNANHDHAGWRRRGDHRKSSASIARMSKNPSGQRTMSHIVRTPPPNSRPMSLPNANITNAIAAHTPAVTVSRSARAYFWGAGRSCSTPYRRFNARSNWPNSVAPVTIAPMVPSTSGNQRDDVPAL